MKRIYLDHAATTPMVPEAREAMRPWLEGRHGNPSSLHEDGRLAKAAIDEAREEVAVRLGCLFGEVVFTSSGTEAANLAIVGAALGNQDSRRNRILLGATEHHCVLSTAPILERLGYKVDLIPVDRIAVVDLEQFAALMGPDVLLVNVMHANNELGSIQPVREIAEKCHKYGALFHCDAVQTLSSTENLVDATRANLITVSAHKIGGPVAGALYIKGGTRVVAVLPGGGQEREMRAGTENVPAIVGLGAAVRALKDCGGSVRRVRDLFVNSLEIEGMQITISDLNRCLPSHAHVRIPGLSAETMLILLDRMGVSASSGSACSSGSLEPSHVLLACGYSPADASEGLRFTFSPRTTEEEAQEAARRVSEAARQIGQVTSEG